MSHQLQNILVILLIRWCMFDRGVCTQAPCYCIVMEYCPYGQLYEVLRNNDTLSPTLLVSWAQQIASGMSYVHSHKIIHRDLKSPKLAFTYYFLSLFHLLRNECST